MPNPAYPIPTFRPVPYVPPYMQEILDDAPIGYWRLGEALIANPATDEMDTYTGTYWTNDQAHNFGQTGINNNANNTAITFNSGAGMYLPGSSWSIGVEASYEAWIKTANTANNRRRIISIQKGGEGGYIFVALEAGYLEYGDVGGLGGWYFWSDIQLYDGAWHHIVITKKDDDKVHAYVDGGELGVGIAFTTGTNSIPEEPWVGRASDTVQSSYGVHESFMGTIDEIAIYNYVLTSTQVTSHYNLGKY